jgi:hypothetical protein
VSDLKLDLMWILGSSERSRAFRRRLAIGASALSAAALSTLLLSRGPYVPLEADLAAAPAALAAPSIEEVPAPAGTAALTTVEPDARTHALQPAPAAPAAAAPEAPAPSALEADTPVVQPAAATEDKAAAPAAAPTAGANAAAEGSPKPAPKPRSTPRPRRPLDPRARQALTNGLAKARALIEEHRDLTALEAFRRLNEEHPGQPEVLEGWSKIAAQTKWWGEALRAAERWVEVDGSSKARLHLARTLRSVGRVEDSIAALRKLVAREPSHREAKELLRRYGGDAVAMRQ